MVVLNYREIKWNSKRVSNIELFLNKYSWDAMKYLSKIEDWKNSRVIIQQLLLMCYMKKKWKYSRLIIKKITQPLKNK